MRSFAIGALAGAAWVLADVLGASFAIGPLFEPSRDGLLLLGVAFVCGTVAAGVVGGLVGVAWRSAWWRPSRWLIVRAAPALFVAVALAGFAVRTGRNLRPLPPRPKVTAVRPVPVLWVVVDTLRADTFAEHAPAAAEFAKSALTFEDAESIAGWTVPSVATLMTGLHENTLDSSAGALPDWAPTAARHFRGAGYATRAVVDNVLLEPRSGFGAGFETFHQRSAYRFVFSLPAFRILPVGVREWLRGTLRVSDEGSSGVTDAALGAMTEDTGGAPLFLYVHYMDPHAPYYPHPELGAEPEGVEPIYYFGARDALVDDPDAKPTPAQLDLLKTRYRREVEALDRDLGWLLGGFRARFGDEALILVTADHGEEFMDHGRLGHGVTAQREMVHVPLIVSLPRSLGVAPGRVSTPVSHLDVLPTLLEATGVTPQPGPPLQGVSWLAWLRGQAPAPARPLVSSHGRNGRRVYRYREGAWVVVRTMFYDGRPTELALYDLATDPTELHDLLKDRTDIAGPLLERLESAAQQLLAARGKHGAGADEQALRALGYIQ